MRLREVELFGYVSTALGIAIFVVACCWDMIAGRMLWHHNAGLGLHQKLLMAGSGLYSFWALSLAGSWHEYQKKIHNIRREV